MKSKKKIIYVSVSVIGLLLIVLGVSYAWFTLTLSGTKTQVIKTGNLELTLDETASDGITLDNAAPIPDSDGLAVSSYKFTLKNTGTLDSDYTLVLTDQAITGTRMPDSAVKYWLKKDRVESAPKLLNTLSNRELDKGVIPAGETINYELKVWIDYNAGNNVQGSKFNTKITINGNQLIVTPAECFTIDATGSITGYDDSSSNCQTNTVVIPQIVNGITVKAIGKADDQYGPFYLKNINKVVIPSGVEVINQNAFYDSGVSEVVIPNTVTTIGSYAFLHCAIGNVVIPSSVMTIGNQAFGDNVLTVVIKGKTSTSQFTSLGSEAFYNVGCGPEGICPTYYFE